MKLISVLLNQSCIMANLLLHLYKCYNVLKCVSIESFASVNGNSAVSHANDHCTVAKSIIIIYLWYACDQLTCSSNHPPAWVICSLITEGWPTWGDLLLHYKT